MKETSDRRNDKGSLSPLPFVLGGEALSMTKASLNIVPSSGGDLMKARAVLKRSTRRQKTRTLGSREPRVMGSRKNAVRPFRPMKINWGIAVPGVS